MTLTAVGMSDHLEADVLNYFKGTAFPAPPTNFYVGLFTTNPTDTQVNPGTGPQAGDGTEMTTTAGASGYTAYARQSIVAASGWSALAAASGDSTGQQISNAAQITFPANNNASQAVTVTGVGIWDAATNGNLKTYFALGSAQSVATGISFQIAVGALVIQFD